MKNYRLTISECGVALKWDISPPCVPIRQAQFSSVEQAMKFVMKLEKMMRSGGADSCGTQEEIGQASN